MRINGYREKLNPSIKNKCVYGIWNNRGSIFTTGFKLSSNRDLETLKSIEMTYREESHIHQFNIPFKTAVWNEEDLPPGGIKKIMMPMRTQSRDSSRTTAAARSRTHSRTMSSRTQLNYPKEQRRPEAAVCKCNDPH